MTDNSKVTRNQQKELTTTNTQSELFERVASILEETRANAVRAINSQMVLAYWLIGREIVEEIQKGEERAEYGMQVLEQLSYQLTQKYGAGFSVPNLQNFRKFYSTFSNRLLIQYPTGTKLSEIAPIEQIQYPSGRESSHGFSPRLSWSHYRALMRVGKPSARDFYEQEAAECGWSKAQLERQIQTSYYERILKAKGPEGLLPANRESLQGVTLEPIHILKSPYVLEFLDLPDSQNLHEKHLEQAIIDNLQAFLLELGKGFSFVARQKRLRFDEQDYYVDLVFYNFILKCFVLIDLKIGKLTHGDVGQMDGYVRLFEDQFKVPGDNPTVGLILCSNKTEAVARYSVLNDSKQIFAAKYLDILPSEEQLRWEIERERRLIEERLDMDEAAFDAADKSSVHEKHERHENKKSEGQDDE